MSLKKLAKQMSLIVPTLDKLASAADRYRPMLRVLDFGKLTGPLGRLSSDLVRSGAGVFDDTWVSCGDDSEEQHAGKRPRQRPLVKCGTNAV